MQRFRLESLRLSSFHEKVKICGVSFGTWSPWETVSGIYSPELLAEKGLFYFGRPGCVRCAFCNRTFDTSVWNATTSITLEHILTKPNCPFHAQSGSNNITIEAEKTSVGPEHSLFEGAFPLVPSGVSINKTPEEFLKLQIYLRQRFFNIHMVQTTDREKSFNVSSWKCSDSSKNLARAGFYFVGPSDYIECFQCGLGFVNWKDSFCPFEHHLFFNPYCTHTVLVKGTLFADRLKQVIASRYVAILNRVSEASDSYTLTNTVVYPETPPMSENGSETALGVLGDCVICLAGCNDIVLFPCRHVSTCGNCTSNLVKCAICNTKFSAFSKVYVVEGADV